MLPLPKKLTLRQKWAYGFYIRPLREIKHYLISIFRFFALSALSVFLFAAAFKIILMLVGYFVIVARAGFNLF